MSAESIGIVELATLTNRELARRGLAREKISSERLRFSGHPRRLSVGWSRTIGAWGGVRTMRDIADQLEVPVRRAHSWAQYRRLKTRTKVYERTPWQLAIIALATPGSARDVATTMGVLPVEVVLFRLAAERMRSEFRVTLRDMLAWTPARLEDAWGILGLSIGNTATQERINLRDPAELECLVRDAAVHARRPDRLDHALATVRRELPDPPEERTSTLRADLAADLDKIIAEAEARVGSEKRR